MLAKGARLTSSLIVTSDDLTRTTTSRSRTFGSRPFLGKTSRECLFGSWAETETLLETGPQTKHFTMSNKRSSSRSPFQKRRAIRRRASMPGLTSLASPEASPPESPISVVLSLAPPSLRRASTNGAPQGLLSNGVDETQHDRCSLCGTRLYKMPSSALFWKRSEKRQIHGRGESGRCFTCEHEGEEALLPFPRLQRQANIRNIESLLNLHENEKIPPSPSEAATATTFSYVGDYNIYGQRHGHGEMIWKNGDRFVGNFFNGLRDGHGCLFLSDGK